MDSPINFRLNGLANKFWEKVMRYGAAVGLVVVAMQWARGEFEIISAVTAFGLSAMLGYAIDLYLARRRKG
jgi:hypothetical protein